MDRKRSILWKVPKDELIKVINEKESIGCILQHFGLRRAGGNYKTLFERMKYDNISIDVLKNRAYDNQFNKFRHEIPLEQVLVENSTYDRKSLKKRLIQLQLLANQCYECGILNQWNGKELILVLDHINGIYNDNRLENLRLLCPNCHSQTDTFAGKNNKTELKFKTRGKKCNTCNKILLNQNKSGYCIDCFGSSKSNKPSSEQLYEMLKTKNKSQIAREFGVSQTAVRKWIKRYKIQIA